MMLSPILLTPIDEHTAHVLATTIDQFHQLQQHNNDHATGTPLSSSPAAAATHLYVRPCSHNALTRTLEGKPLCMIRELIIEQHCSQKRDDDGDAVVGQRICYLIPESVVIQRQDALHPLSDSAILSQSPVTATTTTMLLSTADHDVQLLLQTDTSEPSTKRQQDGNTLLHIELLEQRSSPFHHTRYTALSSLSEEVLSSLNHSASSLNTSEASVWQERNESSLKQKQHVVELDKEEEDDKRGAFVVSEWAEAWNGLREAKAGAGGSVVVRGVAEDDDFEYTFF